MIFIPLLRFSMMEIPLQIYFHAKANIKDCFICYLKKWFWVLKHYFISIKEVFYLYTAQDK